MKLSIEVITILIIVFASATYMILEKVFPYNKGQKILREGFWNDIMMYTAVQSYVLGLVINYIIKAIDSSANISRLHLLSCWPVGLQLAFFIVTHDIYIYWFHRLCHKNIYFWRIHEAHHSTIDVDWLSGARSHSIEILINQTVEFAPILLLGAAPEVAALKGMTSAIWGMFIHSNINIKSDSFIIKFIVNNPDIHRWHHSSKAEDGSCNYGTKFIIWDWLFGTAVPRPYDKKPAAYGLEDVEFPRNYFSQHIFAFRPFKIEEKQEG